MNQERELLKRISTFAKENYPRQMLQLISEIDLVLAKPILADSGDDEVEISLFLNDEGNLSIACNHPAKLYVSHELYDLVGVDEPEYGALH